jgi:hypothetical protein
MEPFFVFAASLFTFTTLDITIRKYNYEGVYYIVHALHNALIVKSTWPDVKNTFTNFQDLPLYEPNYEAIAYCFALHIYHILLYHNKFRFDDWLHHILMIGIALPIGAYLPSSTLVGYSLFFSTGLPGGIDYALLFGVRNNWLAPLKEKRINNWMNVWIRSPGCSSHAAFTIAYCFMMSQGNYGSIFWLSLVPAALMYWNGQYFMNQVVVDYTRRSERSFLD